MRIRFSEVDDSDRVRFLDNYEVSRTDEAVKSVDDAVASFSVPPFRDVWERLQNHDKLGAFADIHRGIEWNSFDKDECYSTEPRTNYRLGYATVSGSQIVAYTPPTAIYLKMDDMRGNSWENDWDAPKLFVNAVRVSRHGWRLAAFMDTAGLIGSQNFHGIWPTTPQYNLPILAAILNGPIASAFVMAHEGVNRKHNRIVTMNRIPLPRLDLKRTNSN